MIPGWRFILAFAAIVLLTILMASAMAHFQLNANIRVIHVEHLEKGLRVYLRLPAPYVLAGLVGEADADGEVAPAPYTTNSIVDGELLHRLDLPAIQADPQGLAALVAKGHVIAVDGVAQEALIEAVRVMPVLTQSPFATLTEAQSSFEGPLLAEEMGEAFVGDSVIDVQLLYETGDPALTYSLASTLNPGLEGQDETANLIIDHFVGEPLVFRKIGLLAEPVEVSRSALKAAWSFVVEGAKHIWAGYDHVLFVLCLTIGALGLGNLLWRVTGFTIGHSVTLIIGFFGFVPTGAWFIPSVEMGIAISIIYAAAIALYSKGGKSTLGVTAAIGLLHGLGFSFVLHEILRLDAPNLWHSLLAFNLGVELGQVAIVLVVWALLWLIARAGEKFLLWTRWALALPCIVIAGLWTGERFLLLINSF